MRITNSITTQGALRMLLTNQRQINAASERVSTGLRFTRASEDPSAAAQVMRASTSLRAIEQYRRNVGAARTRLDTEETVLDQLSNTLMRARELGIAQASGTASAETRRMAQAEVDQLLGHAVSLANTRVNGGHLFGGERPDVAPFTIVTGGATYDFGTASPTGVMQVEVADGQMIGTGHDGTAVFGSQAAGPLAALRQLAQALHADDPAAISAANAVLEQEFDAVQGLIGEVGAWTGQLQVTEANLDALETTLTAFKADVSEVEFEEAVTELVARQTAYQAAMLATSKVMGMNLTDYLR